MKKTILALAVASTAVAAQADNTTLYGEVKGSYDYTKKNSDKAHSKFASEAKIGVKGSEDLGNGLSSVYDVKLKLKGEDKDNKSGSTVDKVYIGLKGDFGTVTVGKQGLPADLANNSDPFNSRTPSGDNEEVEKSFGLKTAKTSNNSIVYKSNDMSGFSFGAAIVANGETENRHADAYQLTGKYEANGLFAGLAYTSARNSKDDHKKREIGLGLGYAADQFSVGVEASQTRYTMKNVSFKKTFARLAATYNVDDANSIYAGYAMTKYKQDNSNVSGKGKGYAVGFNHKFSKRTNAWVEFGVEKTVPANLAGKGRDKAKQLSLGMKTKF